MIHELKTWPRYFAAVAAGRKPFEIRKADRPFRVGDQLDLREWCPEREKYSGRRLLRRVTYILRGGAMGVGEGYCVLGLADVRRRTRPEAGRK